MYKPTRDSLEQIVGGTKLSNNETVFPMKMVKDILKIALDKQWIILGGDIYTTNFDYTYDNWYYEPSGTLPLYDNVQQSILKSDQYISKYREKYGEQYWIAFVISNSYVTGDGSCPRGRSCVTGDGVKPLKK